MAGRDGNAELWEQQAKGVKGFVGDDGIGEHWHKIKENKKQVQGGQDKRKKTSETE